ncbi:hypothetical protein CDD80_5100 [Ophiocordyceps camponoti-rufipedis]|uniref:Uncharacterized protein n=1 Tax=Ophiocordyceps camponoti-rufipedis TaxID=2004952 RepID=A0A2C5YS87_9HYPO|nr:hypothetical protein CDD80_5100 [Ophiocordyceps camponoti-rufipedis]
MAMRDGEGERKRKRAQKSRSWQGRAGGRASFQNEVSTEERCDALAADEMAAMVVDGWWWMVVVDAIVVVEEEGGGGMEETVGRDVRSATAPDRCTEGKDGEARLGQRGSSRVP